MEEDEEVMSEVHIGCSPHLSSCLSSFTIALSGRPETNRASTIQPSEAGKESLLHEQIGDFIGKHVSVDENGDLDIPRRSSRCRHNARSIIDLVLLSEETHRQTISIYHRLKTTIPCVGLQIWKASLILGDFILHKMQTTSELKDAVILELGAGTGILGILLSAKARLVFLTDFNKDVLGNCFRNVLLNSRKSEASMETLRICRLDWQEPWPPIATQIVAETSTDDHSLYLWLESDVDELERVSIVLAADVIYSDHLTDAFFNFLEKLMPSGSKKVLWLSLEKRYNFSLSELAMVAHGYDHFRSFLDFRTEDLSSSSSAQLCRNDEARKSFAGKRIQLAQIPQYLLEYERTDDLELWQVWRN